MSKTKKIATAVVSVVLAASMCVSFAACGGSTTTTNSGSDSSSTNYGSKTYVSTALDNVLTGNISSIYDYDVSNVDLHLAIGHNNNKTSTSYQALGDTGFTMADGTSYSTGDFKPAWRQLKTELGVSKFSDVYGAWSTSANLTNALSTAGTSSWSNTDIITSDLSVVTSAAANGTSFLNLGEYLDYMPNFKAYLEANPIVEYSIVSDYDESTGLKEIYISPYFDGNDDIERYCIARQDWVEILLDSTTSSTATWAASSASSGSVAVESYMGQTGSLEVEITDTSDVTSTTTIYKNYDNVLTQIKSSGTTALKTAYTAIDSTGYTGSSGNIVDIMNTALEANSAATGAQLTALFRAYISACYTTTETGSSSYYDGTSHKLSDLFNGADAAWDVDDLVAMLRCVITSSSDLCVTGVTAAGLFSRTSQNDRTPDLLRLVGQLYGVRGVDSRYEYTYLDVDGNIHDARNDEELWEALDAANALYTEGLIAEDAVDTTISWSDSTYLTGGNGTEGFMMYDFVQTQTANGFFVENESISDSTTNGLSDDYMFAPVLNPLSKWSVNGDDDTIMRFTESWRSTKTSGIAINGSVANDTAKLIACLKFVDYIYSNDGMILMTYGPQATGTDNGNICEGGFWKDTSVEMTTFVGVLDGSSLSGLYSYVSRYSGLTYDEASGQYSIDKTSDLAANYYIYKNTIYTGTYYKGYMAPTITTALYNSFLGTSTIGAAIKDNTNISGSIRSFTSYARMIIGSTLPVAVKDQCFEYQLTSQMGRDGADNVGDALVNGVVKGMTVSLDTATYGNDAYWYMVVPTSLPFESREANSMSTADQTTLQYLTGTLADSSNKNVYSVFIYVIINGLNGGTYTDNAQNWTVGTDAATMVAKMQAQGSKEREGYISDAWERLRGWYNI